MFGSRVHKCSRAPGCLTLVCLFAAHLFAVVGLTPCGLTTTTASVGTTFTIPFSVYDTGQPQMGATAKRTLVIAAPCSPGKADSVHVDWGSYYAVHC